MEKNRGLIRRDKPENRYTLKLTDSAGSMLLNLPNFKVDTR
ncbi:hypothetical protein [Spirosoma lituiforme]